MSRNILRLYSTGTLTAGEFLTLYDVSTSAAAVFPSGGKIVEARIYRYGSTPIAHVSGVFSLGTAIDTDCLIAASQLITGTIVNTCTSDLIALSILPATQIIPIAATTIVLGVTVQNLTAGAVGVDLIYSENF